METPLAPPRWLDQEPQILWGCTQPEMAVLLFGALGVAVPIGALFVLFARIGEVSLALLAVPLCGLLVFLLMRAGAFWVRLAKRGRPADYYRTRWHLALARRGLVTPRYIQTHGRWHLGRDGRD